MIAQGDVLLIPLTDLKVETLAPIKREAGKVVLAHGEVTGHSHAIADAGARLFEPKGKCSFYIEGNQELQLDTAGLGVSVLEVTNQPVTLLHEEHGPHEIAPGKYLVIRQRERSLLDWRAVAD